MARAIEEVPPLRGVQVEEDARHDDDLLLEALLEEVQAVADAVRQAAEVEPDVEGAVGDVAVVEDEADGAQAAEDEVPLGAEVRLQGAHLAQDGAGFEHRDGGFLEGDVGAPVQVRAAAADGFDEFFGAHDPRDAPAREAEAFGEALRGGSGGAVVGARGFGALGLLTSIKRTSSSSTSYRRVSTGCCTKHDVWSPPRSPRPIRWCRRSCWCSCSRRRTRP